MEIRFDGRVAIVTGAGAGLGRSYALELATRGAKVVVNDPGMLPDGSSRAAAVTQEILDAGGDAIADCESVGSRDAAARITTAAMKRFGRIDILINNAGILRDKSFLKMDLDDFDLVLQVHLLGAVYLTKAVFPVMRENRYGRILLTTSAAGLFGNFGQTNYATAKLGLVGFMNALKTEGAKDNITVNTIAPIAATGLAGNTFPEEVLERIQPRFVAAMAIYLVSERCTETGRIMAAGGGYYSNVQMSEGPGVRLDDESAVTVETIARRFPEIVSQKAECHYDSAVDNVSHILAPLMKS